MKRRLYVLTALLLIASSLLFAGCQKEKTKNQKPVKSYEEWVEFYKAFILKHYERWDSTASQNLKNDLRYGLFYLDSDEVPELIIGYGDSHASRLYILTSDGENVYTLGKYGDTASIRYVPQKNLIYDCAGGQGYFRSAVLSIDDNGMVIKGAAISDAHTIESRYYIVDISGFKDTCLAVSDDMTLEGTIGNESSVMYSDVWNGTQTEVDEQEFNDAVSGYLEGNETEYIRYRDLKYSID